MFDNARLLVGEQGNPRSVHGHAVMHQPALAAADLFGDIEAPTAPRALDYWPGLAVTALALLAALFISEHYGAPATLMGLLIGLSLNFLRADRKLQPGLAFAASSLLRTGIILAGARVTLGQIAALGSPALLLVVVITVVTMLAGMLFARLARYDLAFGALAGGAVAICGASAALALAAVLGERRINKAQLTLVLVGISAMSALAMFIYPILAHDIGMTSNQAGFFLGASIHDVAQALGAGYSFSDIAGQTATIVKLERVALLVPVLAIAGVFCARDSSRMTLRGIPWFVLGFLAMVVINSTGVLSGAVSHACATTGSFFVIAALTAAGIRSPMADIRGQGVRSLLVIGGTTLVAAGLSMTVALLLI